MKAIQWSTSGCQVLDQTKLPSEVTYINCDRVSILIDAIQKLAIRGAPVLGVSGAFGVWLAAKEALDKPQDQRHSYFNHLVQKLKSARPTAVNLRWGVEKALSAVYGKPLTTSILQDLKIAADQIYEADIQCNESMAKWGGRLFQGGSAITICNTGDLCTAFGGTAFGVLREAFRVGNLKHIFALETRPLLQGLRLTAWEFQRNEIPCTVICDSAAATIFTKERIDGVIVGADRIAANGDTANKIGTYMLAILCKYHQVPFYVAAPKSTFDLSTPSGSHIHIEQRSSDEIFQILGDNQPKNRFDTFNPAFDVTPHSLITAFVTESGILEKPNVQSIQAFMEKA